MNTVVKIIIAVAMGVLAAVAVSTIAVSFLSDSVYGDTVDPCREALELSQDLVEEYGYENQYITNAALNEDSDAAQEAIDDSDLPEMLTDYYDAVDDCDSVS